MSGYVYIISNPSMPGLVKIGKTTTTPSRRMDELNSTGVPTPFDLEFSVEVADCHASERAAHSALNKYRVSAKREFFKISARNAILTILPSIGAYTLDFAKDQHGIQEIGAKIRKQREKREAELRKQREDQENTRAAAERQRAREKTQQLDEAKRQLSSARAKLCALGSRPTEPSDGLSTFLSLCWVPVPFGWLVWLGARSVFSRGNYDIGYVCVALLFFGFFAYREQENHRSSVAPFLTVEDDVRRLEAAIQIEGGNTSAASKTLSAAFAGAAKQADHGIKFRPFANETRVQETQAQRVARCSREYEAECAARGVAPAPRQETQDERVARCRREYEAECAAGGVAPAPTTAKSAASTGPTAIETQREYFAARLAAQQAERDREARKHADAEANLRQRAAVERYNEFAREREERQAREQAVRDKTALALAKLPENERQSREAWCRYHLSQGMDVRKYIYEG